MTEHTGGYPAGDKPVSEFDPPPPAAVTKSVDPLVVVHECPPDGSGIMPCCGRTPFEALDSRMATDPSLVTCGKVTWIRVKNAPVTKGVLDVAGVTYEQFESIPMKNRIVVVRVDSINPELVDAFAEVREDLERVGGRLLIVAPPFQFTALTDEDLANLGLQRIP